MCLCFFCYLCYFGWICTADSNSKPSFVRVFFVAPPPQYIPIYIYICRPTDPNEAPDGSIRKTILQNYQALGIKEKPNKGDNGVHASASPFEGLVEKMNWLQLQLTTSSEDDDNTGDAFGTSLIKYGGISKETIIEWSKDPQVLRRRTKATKNQEEQQHEEEDRGSIFDTLEDMDAVECYHKLVELNEIN